MTSKLTVATLALTLSTVCTSDAFAQMQWTNQGFVNVTLGVQAPSHELSTQNVFSLYGDDAILATTQDVGGGFFFDISAGYKVWRNLAVGIGYSHVGSEADLVIDASDPGPRFLPTVPGS